MRFPSALSRVVTFGAATVAVLLFLSLHPIARVGPAQTAASPPPQDPQRPVFRGAANLVLVDAYPRSKDGRILEGLAPADFEVREDGVLQKVDQFEFVRVEPVPESLRTEPNNQRDMLREAADPHNRVFVIYLDIPHVDIAGAHYSRQPLMEFLNKAIGPNDLFGVMTWKVAVPNLTLQRKTLSIADQLMKHWAWGEENRLGNDPDDKFEDFLDQCCLCDAQELKRRRRETRALQNLKDLVVYLGLIREARTTLIVFSGGWGQYEPRQVGGQSSPPSITNRNGRLGIDQPADAFSSTSRACQAAQQEILTQDNRLHYRELVDLAVRGNVVFYPIDPGGLRAPVGGLQSDFEKNRLDSLRALAENTNGIPIVDTNDLLGGADRIINDVSAYYLLGYYSTNSKRDGGLRRISVKVKPPGVTVVARRSYVAENAAAVARTEAAARSGASPGAPPDVADAVKAAMGPLARLDSSSAEMFVTAVRRKTELLVIAEVAANQMTQAGGSWNRGVALEITATNDAGEKIGSATGAIEPGARSVLLRIPLVVPAGAARVTVVSKGQGATSSDQVVVPAGTDELVGAPVVWRGTPSAQSALTPVVDLLFRRTERMHIEWPIARVLDRREARLLDRRGLPLAIPATLTERDATGGPIVVADVNLAPISPGDYVVELTASSGTETVRRYVGVRIVR